MGLHPTDNPFSEDQDLRRKAAIEDMMRWQRESYFRNEPVQQEYRDVVTRLASHDEARPDGTGTDLREPGPFDLALERFQERRKSHAGDDLWPGGPKELSSFVGGSKEADMPSVLPVAYTNALQNSPAKVLVEAPTLNVPDRRFANSLGSEVENRLPTQPRAATSAVERTAPERMAQNEPTGAQPRAVTPAKPFVTDGINRVDQNQSRIPKIRKDPLSWELEDQLNFAAFKTGQRVEVTSGGQPIYGKYNQDWTGGNRHSDGGAGDVKLVDVVNGRKRYLNANHEADRQRMGDFIRYSAIAGATGIGQGYMGPETIHIGGGDALAWRSATPFRAAFPWVQKAFAEGTADRQRLMREGWGGLVDTQARGRPLSLKPLQPNPVERLTRQQREQKPVPPPRLLPALY